MSLALEFLAKASLCFAFIAALVLVMWGTNRSDVRFWLEVCWELLLVLLKWAGIVVGGLVALFVAILVLVALANRPTSLASCTDAVATTVAGEVHLTCAY